MRILKSPYFQIPLFLIIGGMLSMHLKYDIVWDFANYHYYNPWAFFNDRIGYDIAPAALNTYFNPLIDMPLYFMIQWFNDIPNLIHFLQGFWFGGLMYAFLRVILLFFDVNTWQGRGAVLASFVIGLTGWAAFVQIGTSSNEIPIALLQMLAFYFVLKATFFSDHQEKVKLNRFLLSGLLLGSAMGLKLTAVTYCFSFGLVLLVFYRQIPDFKKNISLFILGGLLGFLIFNGFWMYILWDKFQNPIFPFLNNIFKSEYYSTTNYRDINYLPVSFLGYLFYPFTVTFGKQVNDLEQMFFDYRLVVVYILLGFSFLRWFFRKCPKPQFNIYNFTLVIFLVSYLTWLMVFSIVRYYIFIEMLSAIIIVKIVFEFFPKREWLRILYISLFIIITYSFVTTPYYSTYMQKKTDDKLIKIMGLYHQMRGELMPREFYGYDKYVNVKKINLPEDTILLIYNLPAAAVLPVLNQYSNVRGILVSPFGYNGEPDGKLFNSGKWQEKKDEIFANHKGLIVALISEPTLSEQVSDRSYLRNNKYIPNMKCRILENNLMPWSLCFPADKEKEIFYEGD